ASARARTRDSIVQEMPFILRRRFCEYAAGVFLLALSVSSDLRAAPPAPRDASHEAAIADYQSQHFVVHTDLSSHDAHELLERLETMLALISQYWGRPSAGVIECYVVKDLDKWPAGS